MNVEKVLQDAGYKTVSGYDAVKQAIANCADDCPETLCSGYKIFPDGTKCEGCDDCVGPDKMNAGSGL